MAVPPQFSNFGKKTKDLFKKTYDFKNELKVVCKTTDATLESGGYQAKPITGFTKATWKDPKLGAFEVESHSDGLLKGKLVSTKWNDVGVTVEGNSDTAASTISAEGAYVKESVAATLKVAHTLDKGTVANASLVVSSDRIAVGGTVDFDNLNAPSGYNVGTEYTQKDLVATVVTADKMNDILLSYFQTVSPRLSLGSTLLVKPEAGSRLLTFGGEFGLDKETNVKFKADSKGVVGTSVTRVLSNPAVKVQASAEFNTAQSTDVFTPKKFGLSLCFGDF